MILTWLIFIPAIGGVLAWVAAKWSTRASRWIALLACLLDLALALGIWIANPTEVIQYTTPWVPGFGISYHLYMDGLSLLLVMLT
jgi:NADH-quinone oxidoreductase subunit M